MKLSKIILPLLVFSLSAFGNIINVPGTYTTIQAAINASQHGDTILVESGTYYENINFRGKKIVITSRYYLTNDPSVIYSTIINGSNPVYPDTGSCVIINKYEDSTTVLQGFTITGGSGTRWTDEHGAGIYREGGGILIQYSSPIIQYNIIHSNIVTNLNGVTSTGGGAIRVGDGYPKIYNNIIMNNTARYGAGIVLNYTGGELVNNIICSNYGSNSYGGGSGIWIWAAFTRAKYIENNTIADNSATGNNTGGVYIDGTVAFFKNNIIWGNTSLYNIQINGNGAWVTYCNIQGGFSGSGNINVNPQFADSNYYLSVSSPCIDKGDSSAIYNDIENPQNPGYAKFPSRGGLRNDMGTYGGPTARVLSNQFIGIKSFQNISPDKYKLYQNYPNPFNPATKIMFDIPSDEKSKMANVKLVIYDIIGRKVALLVNEKLKTGSYEVIWDGRDYPSGVYFYSLETEYFSVTKRMILLK